MMLIQDVAVCLEKAVKDQSHDEQNGEEKSE